MKKINLFNNSLISASSTFITFILLFTYIGYKIYQIKENVVYLVVFFFVGFFCGLYFIVKELKKQK